MPRGVTPSASAMAGTAVLTMVESRACMTNDAEISQIRPRLRSREGAASGAPACRGGAGVTAAFGMGAHDTGVGAPDACTNARSRHRLAFLARSHHVVSEPRVARWRHPFFFPGERNAPACHRP